jgi:hypothetical protein
MPIPCFRNISSKANARILVSLARHEVSGFWPRLSQTAVWIVERAFGHLATLELTDLGTRLHVRGSRGSEWCGAKPRNEDNAAKDRQIPLGLPVHNFGFGMQEVLYQE